MLILQDSDSYIFIYIYIILIQLFCDRNINTWQSAQNTQSKTPQLQATGDMLLFYTFN